MSNGICNLGEQSGETVYVGDVVRFRLSYEYSLGDNVMTIYFDGSLRRKDGITRHCGFFKTPFITLTGSGSDVILVEIPIINTEDGKGRDYHDLVVRMKDENGNIIDEVICPRAVRFGGLKRAVLLSVENIRKV